MLGSEKTDWNCWLSTEAFCLVSVRDRPFNLKGGVMVFCFVQEFFFGQHKSNNIYFFCYAKRDFFPRI